MAIVSPKAQGIRARMDSYRDQRLTRIALKLVAISCCVASLSGCASARGTAFDREMLVEMEERNAKLEAELVRLREKNLRDERAQCPVAEPEPPSSKVERESPELPVVKMTPEEEPEGEVVSIRPAEPEEEEVAPEGTRPVLKVRGRHEAWVYHRPLTEEDRKASQSSQGSPTAPSAKTQPSPKTPSSP